MLVRGSHVSPVLPAGGPLDDKHLLPEVSTLFMAGFESESAFLSVAIHMLSSFRTAQQLCLLLPMRSKHDSVGCRYPHNLLESYACAASEPTSALRD